MFSARKATFSALRLICEEILGKNFEKNVLMFPVGEKRFLSFMGIRSVIFGAVNSIILTMLCAFAYSKHFAFLKFERGGDLGRSRLINMYYLAFYTTCANTILGGKDVEKNCFPVL